MQMLSELTMHARIPPEWILGCVNCEQIFRSTRSLIHFVTPRVWSSDLQSKIPFLTIFVI